MRFDERNSMLLGVAGGGIDVAVTTAMAVAAGGVGLPRQCSECGEVPLHSELSTWVPALVSDAKLVIGWMHSRAAIVGCAPLIIISLDSSSDGLSRTWVARERQRPTYSPNGLWSLYRMATRSSCLGIKSRLK